MKKILIIALLLLAGTAAAQGPPSPGTTVNARQSGTWTVQPGNTPNTAPWLVTIQQGGNPAVVTAAGALKVDGSAVTQPVSGTFWQATQPISAAALPLPALASTSTKQSDGSQKTQVVDGSGNVIGATSNALDVNIKSGNPTTISATQGTSPWVVFGTVTANAGTNLNTSALALEAGGNLANIYATLGTVTASPTSNTIQDRLKTINTTLGSPFQAGGSIGNTAFIANAGTNLNTSALALDTSVGTTNTNLGAPGATACATDTGSCSLNALLQRLAQRLTSIISTLGSPFQAGGSIGNTTFASTQSGTWTVQPGNTPNSTAWLVSERPATSGGLTNYFVQPTASDNHANIKNGAGQVYKIVVTNNSATINYLRLYNAATGFNGCNSATNLVYQVLIPGNSTNGGGISDSWPTGLAFSTGISICVTSAYATTDTTNATASAMSVNIGYN